jgi:hypothetical protein
MARAADVLDRFSTLSVQKKTAQIADEKFEAAMGQLEDVRFVNVSVDSLTVHGLTAIHCIVSKPFFGAPGFVRLASESAFYSRELRILI